MTIDVNAMDAREDSRENHERAWNTADDRGDSRRNPRNAAGDRPNIVENPTGKHGKPRGRLARTHCQAGIKHFPVGEPTVHQETFTTSRG